MRSSDFLKVLSEAMPTSADLEDYGLDPQEIDDVQASFRSAARKSLAGVASTKSELEKMIIEYDCSTVEVGLIRFLPEPRVHPGGVQVAYCEADPIVVIASGLVVMYEHDDSDRSMKCAINSERFLDALDVFITLRREKSRWKGRVDEAANLCADKAGGGDYVPFFRMLCGYLA